jgi:hypothetical protein
MPAGTADLTEASVRLFRYPTDASYNTLNEFTKICISWQGATAEAGSR